MTNERMTFPETWEEYEKDYGFNDSKEVYTNNSRLIPSFRVKQWLDHLPSIQPKPKIGHWIWDYGYATCNQCGYTRDSKDNEGQDIPDNYCPNCGAKMESEDKRIAERSTE